MQINSENMGKQKKEDKLVAELCTPAFIHIKKKMNVDLPNVDITEDSTNTTTEQKCKKHKKKKHKQNSYNNIIMHRDVSSDPQYVNNTSVQIVDITAKKKGFSRENTLQCANEENDVAASKESNNEMNDVVEECTIGCTNKKKRHKNKHQDLETETISLEHDGKMKKESYDIKNRNLSDLDGKQIKRKKDKHYNENDEIIKERNDKMDDIDEEHLMGSTKKRKRHRYKHQEHETEHDDKKEFSNAENSTLPEDLEVKQIKCKKQKTKKHYNEEMNNPDNDVEALHDKVKKQNKHQKKEKCQDKTEGISNDLMVNDDKLKINSRTDTVELVNNANEFIGSPCKSVKESDNTYDAIKVGQWESAAFDDNSMQNKFFRLLGGFKKEMNMTDAKAKFGLGKKLVSKDEIAFPKSSSISGFKTGGHLAMGRRQQELYVNEMEKNYKRALSINLNRGVGLGFQQPAAEGKKFHIDTSKSKSVKFDD